jgi:outer membrane protein assembly factor BamE
MRKILISILCCATLILSACDLYRLEVQQGNVITKDMVDNLKIGMDKSQVQFVMGSPLLEDPFHENRWDYVYSDKPPGKKTKMSRVTIFFKNNKVVSIDKHLNELPTRTD